MDPLPSQSVAIDGLAVRRIREEKRLTQLYVAKVVGVTTDTVSRWENNRYPTIRRDNALNLAEALEVELSEILKKEEVEEEPPALGEDRPGNGRKYLVLSVCAALIVLAVVLVLFQNRAENRPVLTAERTIPKYAAPGSNILVKVAISSEKPLKGMILKERFPAGWQLIESFPPASSVDNLASGSRWIFRTPDRQVSVFYILKVAAVQADSDAAHITGEVIANPDGRHSSVVIENNQSMLLEPLHWADTNGNRVIDDLEILAVSEMTEETGSLNLEWDLIERLWEAGGYRWQEGRTSFVPVLDNDE